MIRMVSGECKRKFPHPKIERHLEKMTFFYHIFRRQTRKKTIRVKINKFFEFSYPKWCSGFALKDSIFFLIHLTNFFPISFCLMPLFRLPFFLPIDLFLMEFFSKSYVRPQNRRRWGIRWRGNINKF